jgi:hypothetical protein
MIQHEGPAPESAPKPVRLPRRGQRKSVGGKAPRKINYIDTVNFTFLAKGSVSQTMRRIVKQCATAALESFGYLEGMRRKEDGAAVLNSYKDAESARTHQYLFHVGIALVVSMNDWARAVEPPYKHQVTVQGYVNEWALGVEDVLAGFHY